MLLKRFNLIISLILLSLLARAQVDKADSLKNLLKESKGVDKLAYPF